MVLFRRIELYMGRQLKYGVDLTIQNDMDGRGEWISKWNLAEKQPALKDIPEYTDEDYTAQFGEQTQKTLLERLEAIESDVSALKEGK